MNWYHFLKKHHKFFQIFLTWFMILKNWVSCIKLEDILSGQNNDSFVHKILEEFRLLWNYGRSFHEFFQIFSIECSIFKKSNVKMRNSVKYPIWNTWGNWVLPKIIYFPQDYKNLKKFQMIYHHKIYFQSFFRMSKSIRELWGRKLLIINFLPCYLNEKLRARAPIQNSRFWPL